MTEKLFTTTKLTLLLRMLDLRVPLHIRSAWFFLFCGWDANASQVVHSESTGTGDSTLTEATLEPSDCQSCSNIRSESGHDKKSMQDEMEHLRHALQILRGA